MELVSGGLIVFGEGMLELAGRIGEARLGYGGDTLNTAVYLARLGSAPRFVSAIGVDPFSEELLTAWRADGVETGLVLRHPSRMPALYAVRTDEAGERSFYYWRDTSAARAFFDLDGAEAAVAAMAQADLLYLSGISLSLYGEAERARLGVVARAVRERGGDVAFDLNYRPRGWSSPEAARRAVEDLAPAVSIALPSLEDSAAVFGDASAEAAAQRWLAFGAAEVVVKRDKAGAFVATAAERHAIPAVLAPRVVDTTGAGDGFNAAYLHARLAGAAPDAAARAGAAMAAVIVAYPGAIIPPQATPAP